MGQLEKMENGSNPGTTTIWVTYETGSNDIYETGQINTPPQSNTNVLWLPLEIANHLESTLKVKKMFKV